MDFETINNVKNSCKLSEFGRKKYWKILSYFGLPSDEKREIDFQRESNLDLELRKLVENSYRYSDEGFSLFVPKFYVRKVEEPLEQAYLRLTKISTILLVEHSLFFDAFGIHLDDEAKKRLVLFSFFKRACDDLVDPTYDPSDVYKIIQGKKNVRGDPESRLAVHLRKMMSLCAPTDQFSNFYKLLPEIRVARRRNIKDSKYEYLKEVARQKSSKSFRLDSYVMINDLPDDFIALRKLTAELFQYIDDMNDFNEDLETGKYTYINQSPDPEKTVRDKFSEVVDAINTNASRFNLYLYLMKYFMERAISNSVRRDK